MPRPRPARSNRHNSKSSESSAAPPRTSVAEQLLIDVLPELAGDRFLCTTLGTARFASAAAARSTTTHVVCQFFDLHFAIEAARALGAQIGSSERSTAPHPQPLSPEGRGEQSNPARNLATGSFNPEPTATVCRSNLELRTSPDFPVDGEFDVVALPLNTTGEAEFVRELLQQGHQALRIGGRMAVAVKNPRDVWLNDELRKLFAKVTRRPTSEDVLYLATKTEPLRKLKNYHCEFAFRDGERLIHLVSRPGVFSHRELDGGARALIKSMEVRDGMNVLDIGCGSGAVGLAASLRAADVSVVSIDSHTRAVECTSRGAALNGITRLTTILTADGNSGEPGSFDLALGNPPYFGDHQIAELFLQAAYRALRPGGTVLIVTKSPAWYESRLPELFDEVCIRSTKSFTVVAAKRT